MTDRWQTQCFNPSKLAETFCFHSSKCSWIKWRLLLAFDDFKLEIARNFDDLLDLNDEIHVSNADWHFAS